MTPRFDEAWVAGRTVADEVAAQGPDVLMVRDLLGRISLVVTESAEAAFTPERRDGLADRLVAECAPFVGMTPVLWSSEMFAPETFLESKDVLLIHERDAASGHGAVSVLDQGVIGRDWGRHGDAPPATWVTLYGFKGGVGRSTASAVLARALAAEGKCVLIVDLDLESPGVSAVALAAEDEPDHGLVDLLVEEAVGNETGLECVARSSRLLGRANGEVWVAPAGGRNREGYSYIPKLNRVYLDLPGNHDSTSTITFAERIRLAVVHCCEQVAGRSRKPDVVLLDSRAGMHDIAAAAITRLSGLSLLFAVDNNQTWAGYSEMFRLWRRDAQLVRLIRERLKMVAAMIPAAHEEEYLVRFRDKAQLLFSEHLYDDSDGADISAFNPPLHDESAPHYPLPILFSADLVGLDVSGGAEWLEQEFVGAAYSRFVAGCVDLILGEEVVRR